MNPFLALFAKADFENLSADDFQNNFSQDKNALLIDVRTKGEHQQARIPGSKLIDVSSRDFAAEVGKLDKSKSVYVYCASGARSRAACNIIKQHGFEKVYNLSGGIHSWKGKLQH
jgi:rhodanese-related sulfurtransferase